MFPPVRAFFTDGFFSAFFAATQTQRSVGLLERAHCCAVSGSFRRRKKHSPGCAAAGKDVMLVSLLSSSGTLSGSGQTKTHITQIIRECSPPKKTIKCNMSQPNPFVVFVSMNTIMSSDSVL